MRKFFKDFKDFISKGNVLDLALAVIIGASFNKIVNSLVNDIIMPLISLAVGGTNVTDWKWVIKPAEYDSVGTELVAETALRYGQFIQCIVDFLIIALTLFIIYKVFMFSKKKIDQLNETIVHETKELTNKLTKKMKKNKKNGQTTEEVVETVDTTNTTDTAEVVAEETTAEENK